MDDDAPINRHPILPNKLGLWMTYRKVSPKQLAEAVGTTVASISRFKNHKISMHSATAAAIAGTLQIDVTELYNRDPYRTATPEEAAQDAIRELLIQSTQNKADASPIKDAAITPPPATKAKRPRR